MDDAHSSLGFDSFMARCYAEREVQSGSYMKIFPFTKISLHSHIFGITVFFSAFLLFFIQPMFAKMILPIFGGAPNVWNGAMCFFQISLLCGYYYAHFLSQRFELRHQIAIHGIFFLTAFLFLPIVINVSKYTAPEGMAPLLWLAWLFLTKIALPFFIISATAPLMQKWFSFSKHERAHDPYFLYAISNTGSLLALFSYPFFIEPKLTLAQQGFFWQNCYVFLFSLILACMIIIWNNAGRAIPAGNVISGSSQNAAIASISLCKKIYWMTLAFVPCSLMYGVTAFIQTDIAAVPLLWVVPLAIYILTYILGFSRRMSGIYRPAKYIFPGAVIIMALSLAFSPNLPLLFTGLCHLGGFFIIAMYCHGELARQRPHTAQLTLFYFLVSVGGVTAGIVNVLLAPMLFSILLEYPLTIILACVVWSSIDTTKKVFMRWVYFLLPSCFLLYFSLLCFLNFSIFIFL